jgi:N6-adenosine-specific RNA methylase IME4
MFPHNMYVMIKNYYRAIVADPPWQYRNVNTGGSMVSGSAAKYTTLPLLDICNMGVPAIAHSGGSVLFLWTTTPFLVDGSATHVMKEWGFKPKTAIYWRKIMSLGMGYWFRGQVEVCLVGIRGDVKAFRCQKPNFIQSKVRAHSQKPEELWQLIEPELDKYKLTPRIELFCRGEPRPGWDGWGSECLNSVQLEL